MANLQITSTQANNITVTVNRGIAGVGIESVSIVYNAPNYFLNFTYTDGTTELVQLPSIAAGVSSFNTRAGAVTLTSGDVTTALGYTPPTPTGTGATGTWTININGNASTVTNGVYTTDTGTVTNTMLAGSIANAKLANSAITINGNATSLGDSVNVGTVTSVTGAAPIASTGGTSPEVSIAQANAATDGYLSSDDWQAFNAKTSNTGTVTNVTGTGNVNGITLTGNVTESGALTLGGSLSSVDLSAQTVGALDVSTRATGILPIANGGTNASTASTARTKLGLGTSAVLNSAVALGTATLDSGGTVPLAQIPASIKGGLNYRGTWNASTNTPTLTSSVGTANDYYVVSVAGTTNLNGTAVWAVNDLAIFNGTVWQKVAASNPTIITANSTSPALTVNQTGTGNALLVEDSTSPDATPTVIDAAGKVFIGSATSIQSPDAGGTPADLALQVSALNSMSGSSASLSYFAVTSTGSAVLNLNKSRGTSLGAQTILNSGDAIASIQFNGSDGTNFIRAASITGGVDGTPGTADMPGRLVFSTTADGASTPTERMRIASDGRFGFNTTPIAAAQYTFGGTFTSSASITRGLVVSGNAPTASTNEIVAFRSSIGTEDGIGTVTSIIGFQAVQGTITGGTRATPTNQYAFIANGTQTGATNNYGFFSNIPAGTGRFNFYANGTAENFFAGSVGIGATANTSALLDVQSTTKGVRMPNMTTTQKNAIASPAAGLMVFDITLSKLSVYTGVAWQTITSA